MRPLGAALLKLLINCDDLIMPKEHLGPISMLADCETDRDREMPIVHKKRAHGNQTLRLLCAAPALLFGSPIIFLRPDYPVVLRFVFQRFVILLKNF